MASTQRMYGGVSAERRRADRRQRLLDAALDIIGEHGMAGLSVRGVCARAGLTSRFFYENFRDTDALAAELFDEQMEHVLARAATAVTDIDTAGDLPAKIRAAGGHFLDELTRDPRIARLVWTEALSHPALAERRLAAIRLIAATGAQWARELLDLPPGPDPRLEATFLLLIGGYAEIALAWQNGAVDLTRDELLDLCRDYTLARVDLVTPH
ncbi:TetR/AcrR family transcriptional regulator [Nocardia thailandica]